MCRLQQVFGAVSCRSPKSCFLSGVVAGRVSLGMSASGWVVEIQRRTALEAWTARDSNSWRQQLFLVGSSPAGPAWSRRLIKVQARP